MATKVLISETVKRTLLGATAERRALYRKAFEFLENGLWEGGLQVKKLRGLSNKTVLEGRVGLSERLLMTLGRETGGDGQSVLLAYVWAIASHDHVDARARAILPENAPFLSFTTFSASQAADIELERLDDSHFTQEPITARVNQETSAQRWFVLDEKEWKRLLLYSGGDFDIFLYLTPEQRELLRTDPPVLLSGTAGSGKTTMAVYYLTHPRYSNRLRLFVTYNLHLRNFSERLYRSLVSLTEQVDERPPEFLTFRELSLRLVADAGNLFRPDHEVDLDAFRDMLRRLPTASKFDPALVWEEIRSIIKGAKPQLEARVLRALVSKVESGMEGAWLAAELREEILGLRRLSLSDKADSVARRVMGIGLREIATELPAHIEHRRPALTRTLRALADVVDKHEADFRSPLMTFAEYEQLGRKRAPAFLEDRHQIYQMAEWYQKNLEQGRLWDEIDLTRAAIRALDSRAVSPRPYDLVCCDEVQDFTDIQLSLIVRLPTHPSCLMLGGDPKQIVNPSGFRWEEVKDLFYDRAIPVPQVHHLTLNFRCVGSIVLLSNALLELKQRLLGVRSDERLDDWKFQGRPPFLIEGVSADELIDNLRVTAPDRVVLTRSEAERDHLKESIGSELVFTIREAKGLEFRTVVLWGFGADPTVNALWSRMLSEDGARLHDAQIRHEINLLYVGMTRAQQDLILYDGPVPSPIWASSLFEELIHRSTSMDFIDEAWRATSSPADWKRQGDYFMDFEHYRAAAECYRNAERRDLMARARAMGAEKQKDLASAAAWWDEAGEPRRAAECYELARKPGLAVPIWQRLGEPERAEDCRVLQLEADGRFADAAEAREGRREFDAAIEDWVKARRPDREAKLWERLRNPAKAAPAYARARDFESAARLYLKLRQPAEAARCLEDAGQFEDALRIWGKLKMPDELLRCAARSGDAIAIGGAHETRGEWKLALEAYRRVKEASRPAAWKAEAELPSRGKAGQARRAIRLELLGLPGAAEAWKKAGEIELAAIAARRDGDFHAAGKLFARQGRHLDAAGMYARSPQDRAVGFRALRNSYWNSFRVGAQPAGHEAWLALARSLRSSKEFEAAAAVYGVLRMRPEVAACLAKCGKIEEAIGLWLDACSFDSVFQYLAETGEYRAAAPLFETRITSYRSYTYGFPQAYDRLIRMWWAAEKSEALRSELAPRLEKLAYQLSFDLLVEILLPLGWLDAIVKANDSFAWTSMADARVVEARSRRARQLEREGDLTGAGLWYLCARHKEDAARCWETLQPNEKNVTALSIAGYQRRVAEYHLANNNLREAGLAFYQAGETTRGAELLDQAGSTWHAADLLEMAGDCDRAYHLYLKANDRKKAARMLEKLKKWAEAQALYQELGDQKRVAACEKKLQKAAAHPRLFPS